MDAQQLFESLFASNTPDPEPQRDRASEEEKLAESNLAISKKPVKKLFEIAIHE